MNSILRDTWIEDNMVVSLHDMHLLRIDYDNEAVVFSFERFNVIIDGQIYVKRNGKVKVLGCQPTDFSRYLFYRMITKKGTHVWGNPITLAGIESLLGKKGKYMELYLEQYNSDFFHWRGELFPNNGVGRFRLPPILTIEMRDFFPMEYSWVD